MRRVKRRRLKVSTGLAIVGAAVALALQLALRRLLSGIETALWPRA